MRKNTRFQLTTEEEKEFFEKKFKESGKETLQAFIEELWEKAMIRDFNHVEKYNQSTSRLIQFRVPENDIKAMKEKSKKLNLSIKEMLLSCL